MKHLKLYLWVPVLFFTFYSIATSKANERETSETNEKKPNIVYILVDDLGYGDLSCYGQTKFSTPNIDELASNGIKFTQHYSGSTVCAPSRSALMTGQHTGHTFIRGNKEIMPEGQYPLESEAITIAEYLKEAGYVTGAFGKWGLGNPGSEGDPNNQGFDEFFGYNCQRDAHHYYPEYLWDNQKRIEISANDDLKRGEYGPEIIHESLINFIETNNPQKTGKPFFCFYPTIIPHAELSAPDNYMEKYRGKFLPEKEYKGVESGNRYKMGGYSSQTESHAAFAAMINVLDDHVGNIVAKLKELGLYENTLIIFTSDNGPHREGGADPDFFDSNGALKGYKTDLYEGGIRVPMLAVWKGKIQAGQTTEHISAFWDVFPTITDIVGMPNSANMDGVSFLPTLLGKNQKQHDHLYWEYFGAGGRKALRKGDWKLVKYHVSSPEKTTTELYNLSTDIGEERNVAKQYPEIVKELTEIMNMSRTESEIFKF